MKTILSLKKSIIYVAAVAAMFSMVSCDDNNDEPKPLTLTDVNGTYQGNIAVDINTGRASEKPGSTITAKVESNKISFEDFPVGDFVIAIEGAEAAEAILEGMEAVPYEVEFESKLNTAQDSIYLTIEPEALAFSYTKTEGEGEEAEEVTTNVKVTIKAGETIGAYHEEKLKLYWVAEEISVNDEALEAYKPQYLRIELIKK